MDASFCKFISAPVRPHSGSQLYTVGSNDSGVATRSGFVKFRDLDTVVQLPLAPVIWGSFRPTRGRETTKNKPVRMSNFGGT